jgi:Lon protease-like protein
VTNEPSAPAPTSLPIFALGTVLFPGGVLPLRVFEARYVDMIRGAMRRDSEFGVCLLRRGAEIGERDIEVEPIGCRARIESWDMEQFGVLQIVAVGTERFEIVDRRVAEDGLLVADVVPLAADFPFVGNDDAASCFTLMRRIVADLDDHSEDGAAKPLIAKPYRLDDAAWVGNRLAELLPMPPVARQRLMSMTDSGARLAEVRAYLAEHGVG